jgi:hypothetical protein
MQQGNDGEAKKNCKPLEKLPKMPQIRAKASIARIAKAEART